MALLPRRITPSSFSRLAREAFIRAAAGHSRLQNGKINYSKVAALTGLPRKEIKRMLEAACFHPDSPMTHVPSERVIRGWLTDGRFLTRQGRPKSLEISGETLSFERLVKEYGGDVSPRAVLEELMRSKAISRVGEQLALRTSRLPNQKDDLGPLARVIPALMDALRIASRQQPSNIDSMLYRVSLHASTEAELELIRQRCSSALRSVLRGLKESLEHEFTIPARKRSSAHALAITILLANSGLPES